MQCYRVAATLQGPLVQPMRAKRLNIISTDRKPKEWLGLVILPYVKFTQRSKSSKFLESLLYQHLEVELSAKIGPESVPYPYTTILDYMFYAQI